MSLHRNYRQLKRAAPVTAGILWVMAVGFIVLCSISASMCVTAVIVAFAGVLFFDTGFQASWDLAWANPLGLFFSSLIMGICFLGGALRS